MPDSDLLHITAKTLADYEATAESFWHGTKDHDVSQNIAALLRHIEGTHRFAILDFGCGPGRDLKILHELGHDPIGVDGTARFVEMARAYSGCEVWHQDFLKLALPPERFDGVFANASLFHVPRQELPRVLTELRACLKPRGVLFSSNPRGKNQEGWSGGRYGVWHEEAEWRDLLMQAGFSELEHYYRPPGVPRARQAWFASVWRK
ncbi:MAG: class I SAM-dependent methyltransferase [Deltaproteobacteria bacterium]|nr:class I SAM-dependent methyltransferase [Deltaproteobacteria bacterium]